MEVSKREIVLVAYSAQTVIDVNNLPNFSFWAGLISCQECRLNRILCQLGRVGFLIIRLAALEVISVRD